MKEVDEEVFLLRIRAISIRLEPIPSLRRLSLEISSISPNTKREQAMARGTTALLKAASVPGLVRAAPLFQRKKPKPEATTPK